MYKWILILFFIFPSSAYAQEGFNNLFEFDLSASLIADMVIDNDTIVVAGMGVTNTSSNQLLYLAKIDTLGNVLDIYTKYNELGNHYYFWRKSSLIKTSDGGYAVCGTSSGDLSVFAKFSHDLELEFIKEFDLENSIVSFYRELIEIEDGFIITGDFDEAGGDDAAFAQKLDLDGNQLWYQTYDDPFIWESGECITQLQNGEILIGGSLGSSKIFTISEIDGSITWENNNADYPNPTTVVLDTEDAGFIRGTYLSYNMTVETFFSNLTVIKYDENKEIEWEKTYEDSLYLPRKFDDITPTPDGHFIGAAWGFIYGYGYTSLVWKFDAETGEEIWKYIFPEEIHTPGHNLYDSFLRSVSVLPSGSVICAGDVREGSPDGGQRAWIMKLDPQGCYTQDSCATIIVDIDDIITNNLIHPKVITYPDPTSDYIQFKLNQGLMHPTEKLTTNIYDVSGKTLFRSIDPDYLSDIQIDVCDYASGIYFYTLHGDKGGVYTGQFVKR